jgi:hypothetical protein
MATTYLIVHQVSYKYIKDIVDDTWRNIAKHAGNPAEFHLVDAIEKVAIQKGSTVFVIGDPFKAFHRVEEVTYIFLNFSVLVMTGSPFSFSFGAYKLLSYKRKVLESKLACFDYILDYWPAQTNILRKKFQKFGKPVDSFPVGLNPVAESALIPLSARKYDVCFVGSDSPRRTKVLNRLAALGISLSPSSGIDLQDAARDSRIVLNLHAYKSEHLELPRMLGAFSTRSALVTEKCNSIHDAFEPNTYLAFDYAALPLRIKDLLDKPEVLDRTAVHGYRWLTDKHMNDCERNWVRIVEHFERREALVD